MRYLVGLVTVLALLATPVGVRAQGGETEPSAEPAPQAPALRLGLDDTGFEAERRPPRTVDGYTLEQMEHRVQLAKLGVGLSAVPVFVGTALALGSAFGGGLFQETAPEESEQRRRTAIGGTVLAGCGALSMVATGILLGVRKRKLRDLRKAEHRAQWDVAKSRLVF